MNRERAGMKIGLVTTSYPRFREDAAGTFVQGMAMAFADRGHRVEVVAPAPPKGPAGARRRPDTGVRVSHFGGCVRGSGLFYGPGAPEALERHPHLWAYVPLVSADLFRVVRTRAPFWDAVVSHWLVPSGLVTCLAADATPHLAVAHSGDVHLLGRLPLRTVACELLCRRTTRVVFSCAAVRDVLLDRLPLSAAKRLFQHCLVQPMGIRTQSLRAGRGLKTRRELGVGGTVALFVGRLVPVKRPEWVIRLSRRIDGMTFLLAGDGPLRVRLEEEVRKDGLASKVRLVGPVNRERKADLLAAADLLVLPSAILPSGRTEGVPLAMLEAMAAGIPVVATDVGGVREVLTDGVEGLVVKPDDFEGMAAAVRRLQADRRLRSEMGKNARQKGAGFDWSVVADRFLEALLA